VSGRIAFDATVSRLGGTGITVYITSLARALQPLLGRRLEIIESVWAAPLGARRTLGDRGRTVMRDLWWHQGGVTRAARRAGCGLLHMPAGLGPIHGRLPLVVTVHDVAVLRFPHLFRLWHGTYARTVLPRVARRARQVIAVSQATKQDVVDLLGVPDDRVTVVYHGVTPPAPTPGDPQQSGRGQTVRDRYRLPERFVLAVGALEPRKNLKRLVAAVQHLRTLSQTRDVVLVHAGPEGLLGRAELQGAVQLLGYVPPEDLVELYRLARCCAYPSLWEGFGFPVLEGMAAGCPVLTSGISALPEIAGDAALLVDPTSTDEIGSALARLWTDDALRADLGRRGIERAREFSWERAARETAAVYDAVLG
jgi:glycosyltransferase involved in cell wall biosynthesis